VTSETLWVSCKGCGKEFPAAMPVDRAALAAAEEETEHECPHCGGRHRYRWGEHRRKKA
jgi:DNA-directed RNA polymerase subunit RPC12/RpoP